MHKMDKGRRNMKHFMKYYVPEYIPDEEKTLTELKLDGLSGSVETIKTHKMCASAKSI